MKGIEIIKDMIFDANLAQAAQTMRLDYDGIDGLSRWATEKFHAKVMWDLSPCPIGEYLCIYGRDMGAKGVDWFMTKHAPNAELIDDDGEDIYIWAIDNT